MSHQIPITIALGSIIQNETQRLFVHSFFFNLREINFIFGDEPWKII